MSLSLDNEYTENKEALIDALTDEMSEDQKAVFLRVRAGENIFLTGLAGTGKSFVINSVDRMATLEGVFLLKTAMTGVAAKNIGGETLHSATGIKLGTDSVSKIVNAIKYNNDQTVLQNWTKSKIMVIDEISMMDGDLLVKLDAIGRALRYEPDKPFGGMQLIACGDFLQLGAVVKRGEKTLPVYKTPLWKEIFPASQVANLTTCHRQKEGKLIRILNKIRQGKFDNETINYINHTLSRPIECPEGIVPTKLFCTNDEVDQENENSLKRLPGEVRRFKAYDSITTADTKFQPNFDELFNAPSELFLKVGAQVMCLRNLKDKGLVNGSVGTVVGFVPHEKSYVDVPLVKFVVDNGGGEFEYAEVPMEPIYFEHEKNSVVVCKRRQVPLKLAWAISVHKAQGLTLDFVEVHLARVFAPGQIYVGMSRSKTEAGLRVVGFEAWKAKGKTDEDALRFYDNL